jgi:hypothetical protein
LPHEPIVVEVTTAYQGTAEPNLHVFEANIHDTDITILMSPILGPSESFPPPETFRASGMMMAITTARVKYTIDYPFQHFYSYFRSENSMYDSIY